MKSAEPINWDELPDMLKIAEAAKIMRIDLAHAYDCAKDGSLPHVRLGRAIRVPKAILQKMCGLAG